MSDPTKGDGDDAPLGSYKRVAELWFPDGNVVVVAGGTAFRLHQGLLSRQSEVFKDLFNIAVPAATADTTPEKIDGCPAMHVSDTAYDFQQLLHALYDPLRIFDNNDVHFSVLAALARMCHKYHMDALLSASVRRLETEYSPTSSKRSTHVDRRAGEAIVAVNLFRLLGRHDLLILALYDLSQLPTSALLRGESRADGTHEILSAHDRELAIELKRELTTRKAFLFFAALGADLPAEGQCAHVPVCTAALLAAQRNEPQEEKTQPREDSASDDILPS